MSKTVLTFYCDDTNPYTAPPEAFKTFLDFVSSEGVAGEASVILGYSWAEHGLLSRPTSDAQSAFIEQAQRAYACGIDSHCELMTHAGLFDFTEMRMPPEAIHEGLWMHEPAISIAEYESYFGHILAEGERVGVRFTGLTWPGCGCKVCTRRYGQLGTRSFVIGLSGILKAGLNRQRLKSAIQGLRNGLQPNPNFWRALLNLAKQGKFRQPTVPCFIRGGVPRLMAHEGLYGVYDLPNNATDRFGIWLNDPDKVNADYYITADGQSGRIVERVRAGAPYCLFYAHWQGLNPGNGVGWQAFTQVVARVQKFLGDQVLWMRPSDYAAQLLREHNAAHPGN